jgi:hypothetical protein
MSSLFALVAAEGVYWLVTGHPEASGARHAAVWGQIVIASCLAIWLSVASKESPGGAPR